MAAGAPDAPLIAQLTAAASSHVRVRNGSLDISQAGLEAVASMSACVGGTGSGPTPHRGCEIRHWLTFCGARVVHDSSSAATLATNGHACVRGPTPSWHACVRGPTPSKNLASPEQPFLAEVQTSGEWPNMVLKRPRFTSGDSDLAPAVLKQPPTPVRVWAAQRQLSWQVVQDPCAAALAGAPAVRLQLGLVSRRMQEPCLGADSARMPQLTK